MTRLLQRGKNSLDFIRFVAAVAVIFTHAYPYSLGDAHQSDDIFNQFTHGQYTFGQFAVMVFFIISGFLVTASMDRSRSAAAYVKARFLRIYPALIVLVLVTIFVLGPLVTSLSLGDYFRRDQTYQYLQVLLLYNPIVHTLPGVFATNPYPSVLNGSLWTLFSEALCYGMVLVLWWLKLLRKKAILLLYVEMVAFRFLTQEIVPYADPANPFIQLLRMAMLFPNLSTFVLLAVPFVAGMVFYLYRNEIMLNRVPVLVGIPLFIACALLGRGLGTFWVPTFGAYSLFYLAASPRSPFRNFGRYGDVSYGMYIYAPLVQQSLVYVSGGVMQPLVNFVFATGVTLIPAVLSWHFVEKPALQLKDRVLSLPHKVAVPAVPKM